MITKTHTGNFTQGQQNAIYTVTVSNGANSGPTNGTVMVTETQPLGLTLVSMAGTGWTCATNNCTRSDVLNAGGSYPPITVTVNVAAEAESPVGAAGVTIIVVESVALAVSVPPPETLTRLTCGELAGWHRSSYPVVEFLSRSHQL